MSSHSDPDASSTKVLLCVTGGIAAYKAAEVLRHLKESGCDVTVVATRAALTFVGEATWAALSGKPVATSLWERAHEVPHISLARWADVIAVVPATADALSRIAGGRADDLVASLCLMAQVPTIMFPAMHTEMWEHPTTVQHVEQLRQRGITIVEPDSGRLTGPDTGVGRLGDPVSISSIILAAAVPGLSAAPLSGKHVVVTAGGTREEIDPVRVITNKSSGQMGYACAASAVAAGARVTVISANVALPPVAGTTTVAVTSHSQMQAALQSAAQSADVVVMAAAVSDYAPEPATEKLKKSGASIAIEMRELPDIIGSLGASRVDARPFLVGFAAETASGNELVALAHKKLVSKSCDMIVANDVSDGAVFGSDTTSIAIVSAAGVSEVAAVSKVTAAAQIIAAVAARLH